MEREACALEPDNLGSNPPSATRLLYILEHVIHPLYLSLNILKLFPYKIDIIILTLLVHCEDLLL